jgi:short-subunit dehydrogenase
MDAKKVLVIFGAGEGISLSVAERFLRNNFKVVLVSRSMKSLLKIKEKLKGTDDQVQIIACDIADAEKLSSSMQNILESNPNIDCILYNAAHLIQGNIFQETIANLVEDFKVNVAPLIPIVQIFKETLASSGGAILVTGGGIAIEPNQDFVSLSLGKSALRNLTQSIVKTLSSTGIFIGTILVQGYVSKEKHLHNPDIIAKIFWELYLDRSVNEIIL